VQLEEVVIHLQLIHLKVMMVVTMEIMDHLLITQVVAEALALLELMVVELLDLVELVVLE
tara:strand:+ start:233 stop:412 length:180 start_codon:yes stop_codon:yes gene_type:complete